MERSVKFESGDNAGIPTTIATADDGGTSIATSTASPAGGNAYQPQHSVSMQQILSPLQLFQHGSAGQPGASLSWMAPYQMMMLPGSAVPQPLFLPPNGAGGVFTMHDGQVFVAPISDGSGNSLMPVDISGNCMLPMATADATSATMDTSADRGVAAPAINASQKVDVPKPPKKPLTPYMIFSKQIWPQVKAEHSHLSSVTELGAIVGQLWRDLDPGQKQQYNELYAQDKTRYDDEMNRYLKQTGLMASDVAKMRSKRPPHVHRPAAVNAAVKDVAAAAGGLQTWSNGGVKQATGQAPGAAGVLPTLYANHDGSITVGGVTAAGMTVDQKSNVLPASVYSDAQGGTLTSTAADAQRSWAWHQPADGSNGVVMYQVAQGDHSAVAASDGQQQGQQLVYNGIPTSGSAADSKAWLQSAGRVEQLEAEIQRLRGALAEKTREVESLRAQLSSLMHSLNKEPPRLTPDTLQTMPSATDVQLQSASVENNNTPKSDMPATVVNGMPE